MFFLEYTYFSTMKKLLLFLIAFAAVNCSIEKDQIENNNLIGDWKLTSIVNETNNSVQTPDGFENSNDIIISFEDHNTYNGTTLVNEFWGNYAVNKTQTVLIFIDLFSSEAGEPAWGRLFYDSLQQNFNIAIQNYQSDIALTQNKLKIYFSEFEYMVFESQ